MLNFNGQEWKQDPLNGSLILFLSHPPHGGKRVIWNMSLIFTSPERDDENPGGSLARHLFVEVMGSLPRACDWRNMEGMVFESTEEDLLDFDVWVDDPDAADRPMLSTNAGTVRFLRRTGWRFEVELSAWFAPEASIGWQLERLHERLAVAGGLAEPETEERFNANFYTVGEVAFTQVCFTVPVNAPNPLKLAQAMTRHRLKVGKFRKVYINGAEHEPATPQTGLCADGRLVMLETPCH